MRVAVVGLGSMGKRRMRLVRVIDPSIEIIGIDSNVKRAAGVSREFGIEVVSSFGEALFRDPDCVLVCTSPLSHAGLLDAALDAGLPAFTELNLVPQGYDRFIAQEESAKLFLSSTFLYRRDVRRIIAACEGVRANYVYHSGQYLPDWHPWENFRDYFVGDARTNGCREILAIELPWLISCFGPIAKTTVHKDSISGLDLGYPDTYQVMIEHEGGSHGLLAVDVVSRKPTRSFAAYGEGIHVLWEGTPDSLFLFDGESASMCACDLYETVTHDDRYAANIIEDAYEDELRAFFAWVDKNDKSYVRYSFAKDACVLSLIDEIEGDR